MDEKSGMRQFWLRTLLVIGMLWGFLPFAMAPFITRGTKDTSFDVIASVVNSLTILPACVLAFWHRRIACFWLTVNAVLLSVALVTYILRTGQREAVMIVEVAGPILIAICLDVVEVLGWPAALDRRKTKPRQT